MTEPGEQHSRHAGAITARSFLIPGVFFLIFVALVAGCWFIGFRSDWDLSSEVGTGRNRTTAGIGMVIVGVFAALSLLVGIRVLRRELGFSPVGREKTD
jgi:uncharacterized membrane protein